MKMKNQQKQLRPLIQISIAKLYKRVSTYLPCLFTRNFTTHLSINFTFIISILILLSVNLYAGWQIKQPFDPSTQETILVSFPGSHQIGGEGIEAGESYFFRKFKDKLYFSVRADGTLTPTKIYCFDPVNPSTVSVILSNTTNKFLCIYPSTNYLYISHINGKLWQYNGTTVIEVTGHPFTSTNYIVSMAEFNGKLYFGTLLGNIYEYDGVTFSLKTTITSNKAIKDLYVWKGYLYGVTYEDYSYSSKIFRTNDGINYNIIGSFNCYWFSGFTSDGNYLYVSSVENASGASFAIRSTSDGINWTRIFYTTSEGKALNGQPCFFSQNNKVYYITIWGGSHRLVPCVGGMVDARIVLPRAYASLQEYDGRLFVLGSQTSTYGVSPSVISILGNYESTTTGTIAGKVTKSDGMTAVSGAVVELLSLGVMVSSTTTDTNGNYTITVATGMYVILVSKSGYYNQVQQNVSLSAGVTVTKNFKLYTAEETIAGWQKITPGGANPDERLWQATIYDANKERMVVYGGYNNLVNPINNTFALYTSTPGAETWTQTGTSGSLPTNGSNAVSVYDPINNRMIVFGGQSWTNKTYSLNLTNDTWSLLSPSGLAPNRSEASAIYDPIGKRMIVFGGRSSSSVHTNTVFALNLGTPGSESWEQLYPSGISPSVRYVAGAIYDPIRHRMIIFGGGNPSTLLNDLWALNLANLSWTQLSPSGTLPSIRASINHVVYDNLRHRMILFGGGAYPSSLNDLFVFDLSSNNGTWYSVTTSTAPEARDAFSFIYDSENDRCILYGGNGSYTFGDTWVLGFNSVTMGTLSGKVTKSDTVTPIPGTVVELWSLGVRGSSTTTGTDGMYQFVNVSTGTYDMFVSSVGFYSTLKQNVTVSAGQVTTGDVSLSTSPAGLVGYWSFNEGSGPKAYDYSGNGNHGTIYGATWVDGKVGKALSFDGVNDYVNAEFGIDPTGYELTVIANINPRSVTIGDVVRKMAQTGDSGGFYIQYSYNSNKSIEIDVKSIGRNYVQSDNICNINQWQNVAFVYKNGITKLYFQGNIIAEKTGPDSPITHSNQYLAIGRLPNYNSNWFNGIIDEVRIYNRALSQAEIQADMGISTQTVTGTVSGKVTKADTVTGISGAVVEAFQGSSLKAQGTSNTSGTYNLINVSTGVYDLRITADGYWTQVNHGVTVYTSSTNYVDFVMHSTSSVQDFVWTTKSPMPTARWAFAAGVINNKIYAIGGEIQGGYSNKVEEYSPATNQWTTKANMPTTRRYLAIGVINNKLYAVGGSGYLNTVEEYDPATNIWVSKANMPTARDSLSIAVVNNKLYAIGGVNGSGFLNTVEEYNPLTNTWTIKANMLTRRDNVGIGVINNKIYAIGGYYNSDLNLTDEYDPIINQWTTKVNMFTAREGLSVGIVNNKIYAIGGHTYSNNNFFSSVEEYSPDTNNWIYTTNISTARAWFAAGVINNKIYVIGGGYKGNYLNVVEEGRVNNLPTLTWTGETGYTSDGVSPDTGGTNTVFTFRVKYRDDDNDVPKPGYPKLVIKKDDTVISSNIMTTTSPAPSPTSGEGVVYSVTISTLSAGNYTYYFTAYDVYGSTAWGSATGIMPGPVVSSGTVTVGMVSGKVTRADSGVAVSGAVVEVLDRGTGYALHVTTSATDGTYQFVNVSTGVYEVKASMTGYAIKVVSNVVVEAGLTTILNLSLNLINVPTYYIKGYVKDTNGVGVPNVMVNCTGTSPSFTGINPYTTTATGYYEFVGITSGSYIVTLNKPGYSFTPFTREYPVLNQSYENQNFVATATLYFIKGYIRDSRGVGVPDVTVNCTGTSPSFTGINPYTTTSTGYYEFTGLASGNYTVTPTKVGGYISPNNRAYVPLDTNKDNQDFTVTSTVAPTYSISGFVKDGQGTGMTGVTVGLINQTSTITGQYVTGLTGYYEFTGLPSETYLVNADKSGGYSFVPVSRSTPTLSDNITGWDFTGTYIPPPVTVGTLSGKVTKSDTVTPISGSVITLLRDYVFTSSTMSATDGTYQLINVSPGTYEVKARATGYATKVVRKVKVTAGETTEVNFVLSWLERSRVDVVNTVFDPSSGQKMQITCDVPVSGEVDVKIVDSTGKEMCTLMKEVKEKGSYVIEWDGRDKSGFDGGSGIYFIRFKTGDGSYQLKKIMIIR